MNSVRSNDISLKYQRCTTLGSKDKGIKNSEFVTKTPFLLHVGNFSTMILLLANCVVKFFVVASCFMAVGNCFYTCCLINWLL